MPAPRSCRTRLRPDPAECARRAGQSIEVLFRYYAKFLDGVREQANRLIEQSMKEWDRVSQGAEPER
ncbi:integrase [Streptomyces sp. G44]|uniref:integrase n=1 Tax=Streptomyces sp. G44 TaxID=2807632 RepID=UPI0027DAC32C|nr:integrase [Streptomyces sp. G44]